MICRYIAAAAAAAAPLATRPSGFNEAPSVAVRTVRTEMFRRQGGGSDTVEVPPCSVCVTSPQTGKQRVNGQETEGRERSHFEENVRPVPAKREELNSKYSVRVLTTVN